MNAGYVKKTDKRYPELLRKIPDAPKGLFFKGNWTKDIFSKCLAVVGSRRMTSYGRQMAESIAGEAAGAGITVVSGFMYGIDAAAHSAAIEAGGRTIAVMPCGIERIHPEFQEELYQKILQNRGLVVSEYEGDMPPGYWTYPRRNRIVAGLSQAVLVVEAGAKSGSLITASLARRFGRKVFAVPGPATSELSKGIYQLLKEGGASLVTEAADIFPVYGIENQAGSGIKKTFLNLSENEQEIIKLLRREPADIDDLARALGAPVAELGTLLSVMEIKGVVRSERGLYYQNKL